MSAPPPRWAERLLDRCLPEGTAAAVKADLERELGEVERARGSRAARRWYVRAAVELAARFLFEALRPRAGRIPGGDGMGEGLRRNVRLAMRRFTRAPGFTAVAAGTIALGVGANVAIFSVVRAVLLDPLPYDEPEELVAIWEWDVESGRTDNPVNPGNFAAWRERTGSFEAMSAVSLARPFTLTADGEAHEVWGQLAHPDFFEVLGLEAALGRTFTPDAGERGGTEIVVSHAYWSGPMGGDPSVIGEAVQLDGTVVTVVGVLPPEYVVFGEATELWASAPLDLGTQTDTGRWIMVLGRLRDADRFVLAAEELSSVGAGLREEFPDANAGWDVRPVRVMDEIVGDVRRPLWVLMGAVGLLLLIACANVAGLLIVRATERQQEMAVRTSMGATGRALSAQLLTEGVLLATLGALGGIALGAVGTPALARFVPGAFALPRVDAVAVDPSVLVFTVALTSLTGLLFGMVPALHALRASPATTLNAESRGPSRRTATIRSMLVAGEIGVSVVLLSGAGLLGLSLATLVSVDPGIRTDGVLAARVNLSGARFRGQPRERADFFEELASRLESRPGVEAAGGISFLPLSGQGAATTYERTDRPSPEPDDRASADIMNVSGRYLEALGVPLLRGRVLDDREGFDAPRAVVVSQSLVDERFAGEDPIGRSLGIDWNRHNPWEIVGVVGDVRMGGLHAAPSPTIYMTVAQSPVFSWQQIVVRGSGEARALTPVLGEEVRALDPSVPVGTVRSMSDVVRGSTDRARLTAFMMGIFAALATLLSAVGLYGLVAEVVAQRTREVGIRLAIGARPADVVRLVMRQGTALAAAGSIVGVGVALLTGRVVSSLLFEVRAWDPLVIGGAAALLVAVAALACALPAWRAARVAPARALRG